jgi:hypothetical protein
MENSNSLIRVARLAGILYLVQMATAMIAEIAIFAPLRVRGDVAKSMANISQNETLFRAGLATMLFTSLIVVVLIWALYRILKTVDRDLALLGVFWRMVETAIVCVAPLNQIIALRLIGNAEYLKVIEKDELNSLAQVFLNAYGSSLYLGFICTGLGSIVFAYLFYKSGYIPSALAMLGMIGSSLLVLGSFVALIFPTMTKFYYPYGMIPMFFWEVGVGFWMMKNGLRVGAAKLDGNL